VTADNDLPPIHPKFCVRWRDACRHVCCVKRAWFANDLSLSTVVKTVAATFLTLRPVAGEKMSDVMASEHVICHVPWRHCSDLFTCCVMSPRLCRSVEPSVSSSSHGKPTRAECRTPNGHVHDALAVKLHCALLYTAIIPLCSLHRRLI